MELLHLVLLAIIQGLTEFLPISSSAHLLLPSVLFDGWQDQGPLLDVMAHVGTLGAVILYFRKDVLQMIRGGFDLLGGEKSAGARLAMNILLTVPPTLILGLILYTTNLYDWMRSPEVAPTLIAATTIIFGAVLWWSDVYGRREKDIDVLTPKGALAMGLAQMIALIPGVSRSGITMSAARVMGYERDEAARLSMLMSIPVICALGFYAVLEMSSSPSASANLGDGILMLVLSFGCAYFAISLFMNLIKRVGFLPFVIYRFILGAFLIGIIFAG